MTSRPSSLPVIIAIAALLLVPLGAYLGGYFWLGVKLDRDDQTLRLYLREWQRTIYRPAARAESLMTGRQVEVEDLSAWFTLKDSSPLWWMP